MSKQRHKFLPNGTIEEVTASHLHRYEAITGEPVALPVPTEKVVEQASGCASPATRSRRGRASRSSETACSQRII